MHTDRLQSVYLIAAITLLLTATHAHRLLFVENQSLITIVFRDVGPLTVSLLIMGAVYWLYLQNLRVAPQVRIFAWFVVGVVTMGVIGFLIGITEQPSGGPVDLPYYLILNSATAGAGIGLIIGSYDYRIRRRDQALLGLHENTQDLLGAKSKEEAGQVTVDTAQSILQLPLTGLWLRNEDVLEIVAISDVAEQAFDNHPSFENKEGLAWQVYENQEPELFERVSEHENVHNPDTQVESEYIVPVGEYGVIISGSFSGNDFSTVQLELADLMAANTELVLDRIERTETLETREDELRKQNERLEQFASVVSHDLRNPLNVIGGYVELARENPKDEYFDEMEFAVERMETLTDDLLALAQTGKSIQTRDSVILGSVVDNACNTVDLEGVDVMIDDDLGMVEAEESRLQQVFENLFRNVVEHAEYADRITVEGVENGFAIEDNGRGIPADEQDDVLRYGYTNAEDGTGLGLAIVQEIVNVHGWEIDVTNGDATGGARFEITDVDLHEVPSTI